MLMQAYNEEGKYKEAVESGERFLELKNRIGYMKLTK